MPLITINIFIGVELISLFLSYKFVNERDFFKTFERRHVFWVESDTVEKLLVILRVLVRIDTLLLQFSKLNCQLILLRHAVKVLESFMHLFIVRVSNHCLHEQWGQQMLYALGHIFIHVLKFFAIH